MTAQLEQTCPAYRRYMDIIENHGGKFLNLPVRQPKTGSSYDVDVGELVCRMPIIRVEEDEAGDEEEWESACPFVATSTNNLRKHMASKKHKSASILDGTGGAPSTSKIEEAKNTYRAIMRAHKNAVDEEELNLLTPFTGTNTGTGTTPTTNAMQNFHLNSSSPLAKASSSKSTPAPSSSGTGRSTSASTSSKPPNAQPRSKVAPPGVSFPKQSNGNPNWKRIRTQVTHAGYDYPCDTCSAQSEKQCFRSTVCMRWGFYPDDRAEMNVPRVRGDKGSPLEQSNAKTDTTTGKPTGKKTSTNTSTASNAAGAEGSKKTNETATEGTQKEADKGTGDSTGMDTGKGSSAASPQQISSDASSLLSDEF